VPSARCRAGDPLVTTEPLDLSLLLRAYATGVFPMADSADAPDVYWVEPKKRGILPLDGFHVSKSLSKTLKSDRFVSTVDAAFEDVVTLCGQPAPDRKSTWINDQIFDAVCRLHAAGQAHSIETWLDGELVGGLYGIRLGRAFFGESMFSRATDASKLALCHLIARMRVGGFDLLDCQFITPHLKTLGAIEISRDDYLVRLEDALSQETKPDGDFFALDQSVPLEPSDDESPPRAMIVSGPVSGWRIWQALTQTS
jgi:leucyl/phenylalanyl-tRNA--protein transferase